MKICFCIGKLSFSGAENVIRYLSEQLIAKGHEVSAVLLEKMPDASDNIEGLIAENAIISEGGFKNALKRIKAERAALKKLKPDVFVIFNYAMAFTAVPASLAIPGTKVIVCERNDPTMVPKTSKRRMARDILFGWADACVSQTEAISSYFDKKVKKRYVIPNPIREKGSMCPELSQRKNIFVTVARLDDYQKNQTMMIKGFAEAIKNNPGFELHFLGSGDDLEKYKDLVRELGAENNIKFLGRHPNPSEYIRNCRAFLLTSDYEGMPNALIEAMSIGLPCISTDCLGGGAAALIKSGENGFLIDRNDVKSLAEKISLLMDDDTLCNKLGKNAFNINETLSGDRIVAEWEKLFLDISKI